MTRSNFTFHTVPICFINHTPFSTQQKNLKHTFRRNNKSLFEAYRLGVYLIFYEFRVTDSELNQNSYYSIKNRFEKHLMKVALLE